jgi:peptidyl-prolyl cis-trans isomerase C
MRSCLLSLRILVCFTIFLAVLCFGCEQKTPDKTDANKSEPGPSIVETETDANTAEPNATAEITTTDDIAVTVNGTNITEAELEQAMKPQLDAVAKQAANLPPEFMEQYKKQIKPRILNRLINEKLLIEKIRESNIEITDEEVINQIEKLISNQQEPLSLEDFKKKVAEHGLNFEDMKNDVRRRLSFEKFMDSLSEGKINVTEEDARKYYDENPKRFEIPEQIAASHILIKPEQIDPNSDDPNEAKAKAKTAALEKAQDLLKQIKDGADFAELAKANSDCPSAKDGGDLKFFPKGQMIPPFEKAAFELELGEVSDIVETPHGYHIIKNTGHKDASVIQFDEVKNSIMKQLVQKQKNEFAKDYIESLKAEADIVYPPGKEPSSDANSP